MWLIPALGLPLLALLVFVWIAGIVRDFPVWALPGMGIILFFVSIFLHLSAQLLIILAVLRPVYGISGWPAGLSLAENIGLMLLVQLMFLLILAAVVAGLLRIAPGLFGKVREDWTILSFLLYGIGILPILLWSDEYLGVEWYQTISLLVMAVGAGLYLIVSKRWQRALALVLPAAISQIVMSIGLYRLIPAQPWANPADTSFTIWEAIQPTLFLAPLPIVLLLAALAPRLPWGVDHEPVEPHGA